MPKRFRQFAMWGLAAMAGGCGCLILLAVLGRQARPPEQTQAIAPTAQAVDTTAPTEPTVAADSPTAAQEPTASPVPPTTKPAFVPKVGEEAHLVSTASDVFVAVDDAAWDAMFKAIAAKDTEGMMQLVLAGKVFVVPVGTRVRVIEGGFTSVKVRILEGAHQAKAGWVPIEMVGP